MKKIFLVFVMALFVFSSSSVFAAPCEYSTQKASNGSSCGKRSADSRVGYTKKSNKKSTYKPKYTSGSKGSNKGKR